MLPETANIGRGCGVKIVDTGTRMHVNGADAGICHLTLAIRPISNTREHCSFAAKDLNAYGSGTTTVG
jgi:hypothetical protein